MSTYHQEAIKGLTETVLVLKDQIVKLEAERDAVIFELRKQIEDLAHKTDAYLPERRTS